MKHSTGSRPSRPVLLFVRLWQDINQSAPLLQQRVLAVSPEKAIVQVMKEHRLHSAARASVSHSALDHEPLFQVVCLIVKGDKRSWKLDLMKGGRS